MLIQEHIILSSFISKVDYTAKYICHFAVDMYHSFKTFGILNWVIVLNHIMLNLRQYNKIIWHWFWCGQETCNSIGTFSCFQRRCLGFKCPLPIVTLELKTHTHTHIVKCTWNRQLDSLPGAIGLRFLFFCYVSVLHLCLSRCYIFGG